MDIGQGHPQVALLRPRSSDPRPSAPIHAHRPSIHRVWTAYGRFQSLQCLMSPVDIGPGHGVAGRDIGAKRGVDIPVAGGVSVPSVDIAAA